jgi:predicted AAA+ superfamily ATPase
MMKSSYSRALFPCFNAKTPEKIPKFWHCFFWFERLCKQMFPDYHYVNLEDIAKTEIIKQNPKAFLEIHSQGLIVDDVQQYPDLFSYVQVVVDENPESHIVLIGSSNFALLQRVTQSLAGRTAVLNLLPLSLSELGKERLTASTDRI